VLHPLPCHRFEPEPEGGVRCVSSARRDLCGGRGAILVPTATLPGPIAPPTWRPVRDPVERHWRASSSGSSPARR
jgi:hypothetical protein